MTEQPGLFEAHGANHSFEQDPALRIRESRRARRLILRLLPSQVLELVVPRGTRASAVAAFVHRHRRFIARARHAIVERRSSGDFVWPARLALPAIGQAWQIDYRTSPEGAPWHASGDRLCVQTRDGTWAEAREALRAWLVHVARERLTPWLWRVSEGVGRQPSGVTIRLQRTRWGSCSSRGRVSLNAGLLFLEPDVVRYLLVHELCHLICLDHSPRFWQAVERFEPEGLALDRKLRAATSVVPPWVHAEH